MIKAQMRARIAADRELIESLSARVESLEARIKAGRFPRRRRLEPSSVGWLLLATQYREVVERLILNAPEAETGEIRQHERAK